MPALRLRPSAVLLPTGAGICVRSDLATFQLSGADAAAFVEHVAPLCDGTRTAAEIAAALTGYSPRSVAALLGTLEARGLIEAVPEGPPSSRRGQEAFFRAWPAALPGPSARLAAARVLVIGRAPWCRTAATELSASGVGEVTEAPAAPPLDASWTLLLASAQADAADVEALARAAHRAGLPSLWADLAGATAILGPLVTPGETACRICADVDALNPPLPRARPAETGVDDGPRSPRALLLGHHAALQAIQVLSGYAPPMLGGRLLLHDLATLTSTRHTLVRVPWCRVCGG